MESFHSDKSILYAFIVFDSVPPNGEGADPVIYWFYPSDGFSSDQKLNLTGLIITFLSFSQKWGANSPCDYILTNLHEITVLELKNSLTLALITHKAVSSKRSLLRSLLEYCKSMYFSFFYSDVVINQTCSREEISKSITTIFPYIINSIDWFQTNFTLLFNSYPSQGLEGGNEELAHLCNSLIQSDPQYFDNIIILHRKNRVVYSSFNKDVTRALSYGMRKKFSYIYLHQPVVKSDSLHWLVGLYYNANNLKSLYQPLVYIDGKPHGIIAFKFKKFKIVLTVSNQLGFCEEKYDSMPLKIREIVKFLNTSNPKRPNFCPFPYVLSSNYTNMQTYISLSDHINPQSRSIIHTSFIKAHEHSMYYDETTTIGFPYINDFAVVCVNDKDAGIESIVSIQCERKKITEYLYITKRLKNVLQPEKLVSVV